MTIFLFNLFFFSSWDTTVLVGGTFSCPDGTTQTDISLCNGVNTTTALSIRTAPPVPNGPTNGNNDNTDVTGPPSTPSLYMVIGIVGGAIVLLIIISVIACCCYINRSSSTPLNNLKRNQGIALAPLPFASTAGAVSIPITDNLMQPNMSSSDDIRLEI